MNDEMNIEKFITDCEKVIRECPWPGTAAEAKQIAEWLKELLEYRKKPEIIHCKDCKHFSMTTLGMPYACWRGGSTVWGETGEHKNHHCCIRVDSPEHFCSYAERREE